MKQILKKALKFYNEGVNYMPCESTLLAARGICKYEMGDEEGAEQDQLRLQKLGFFENNKQEENMILIAASK